MTRPAADRSARSPIGGSRRWPTLPEDAELVALWIGQHHRGDFPLSDVDAGRSEGDQSIDLGVLTGRSSSKQLAALAKTLGPEFEAMAHLGTVLGLRWGECAGLRVGPIDFDRSTVTVAEQVTRGAGGRSVVGPPKSDAGRRTLAVPAARIEHLSQHLKRRELGAEHRDAFIFGTPNGDHLDYSNWLHRIWYPARAKASLDWLQFHGLRRANATELVLEGIDLKTAQTRLGHTDPRLTLGIYAQATTEADRQAADRLGERFLPRRDLGRGRSLTSDARPEGTARLGSPAWFNLPEETHDGRNVLCRHRPQLRGVDPVVMMTQPIAHLRHVGPRDLGVGVGDIGRLALDASPMISRHRSTARRNTTSVSNASRPRWTIAAISSAAMIMSAKRWTSDRLTA